MKLLSTPEVKPVADLNKQGENPGDHNVSRRRFFRLAGAVAGGGLLLDACRRGPSNNVYLGKGDTGLMNYLYVIAQLQAGFYTQAYATPYYNPTASQLSEYQLMADLRDHQLAYMDIYAKILGASALSKIVLQLSQVTFSERTSTLTHATILQDHAVGAYNGVVQLFSDKSYTELFAKIASVEGRHAEYVRDTLNYNTFGDGTAIDSNGLGQALSPNVALPLFQTYIQTIFDSSGVPSF